ncbi:hypothetical protein CAOG_009788 [Capsaspora owczarzaki ATCC 30864]|uniref:NOD3 protein n=1 Tax=Capsaspora owczarzaki (strain ATCC 30864) TaxID=595528 RepID=A0A0D2UG19_CAPO3|nr:hypothetical protein CAOG_009788 [Capsaspora owczarzaki ATCC 30864]
MLSYQSMSAKQRELYDKVKNASQWFELPYNQIDDAGAQAIAEGLKSNSKVTGLSLWSNQIGDAGARVIAETLKVNMTITELDLNYNQIGDAGAQAIAETLKVNTTLIKIDLHGNQIGDAGAQAIAETLKVNTTVTNLGLYNNKLGDAGATAMAEMLKVNKMLTSLGLSSNLIADAGALAIAEALRVNTTMTSLGMGHYQIGDAGANAIAESLKGTDSLGKNRIGDAGAQAIAEAVKVNNNLRFLIFDENEIGDAGAQAIAEALKVNSTLYSLYLEDNQIGDAGAQAINKVFKMNPKLVEVPLARNCISNTCSQAIKQCNGQNGPAIYDQVNPLAFSLLPRFATADDLQTVFCLLTGEPALEDQSSLLPALPAEIADIIMDKAQYWQGVQHTKRNPYDDRPVKVTVPQSIHGNSTRVKAIQVVRDTKKLYYRIGDNVFDLIVRDERGAVQYEYAAKATFVDSTLVSATLWPASTPIIRQIRVGWQVQVQPSKSARDVLHQRRVFSAKNDPAGTAEPAGPDTLPPPGPPLGEECEGPTGVDPGRDAGNADADLASGLAAGLQQL